MRNRRGWVILDVLMGMMIVTFLGAILATAAAMHQRAMRHLQDTAAANRLAETALLEMQSHQKPTANNGGHIFCEKLPDPAAPGTVWISLRATVHAQTATLIGVVPQSSIPDGEQ